MRISDWSSDVCSSDLSLGEYSALVASGALAFADALRLVELRGQLMQSAVPEGVGGMAAVVGLDDATVEAFCAEYPGEGVQIGRASCRERGCQYVSISVVAVPLKKKKSYKYM